MVQIHDIGNRRDFGNSGGHESIVRVYANQTANFVKIFEIVFRKPQTDVKSVQNAGPRLKPGIDADGFMRGFNNPRLPPTRAFPQAKIKSFPSLAR
jgi:hypothetical protein